MSRKVVPIPSLLSTETDPPTFSTFSRTMASPRPRPETSVIIGLVETPDLKMRKRRLLIIHLREHLLETRPELDRHRTYFLKINARAIVRDDDFDLVCTFGGDGDGDGRPQPVSLLLPAASGSRCRDRCSFLPGESEGLSFPPKSAGRLRSRRLRLSESASLPQSRQRSRTSLGKDSRSAEKGSIEIRFMSSTRSSTLRSSARRSFSRSLGQEPQACSAPSAGRSHCGRERQKPSQFVLWWPLVRWTSVVCPLGLMPSVEQSCAMACAWGRTFLHSFSHEANAGRFLATQSMRWAAVALSGINSSAWRRSESSFECGTLSVSR